MVDVVVIGAGVIGCAVAREISRYCLKVVVLDRTADVATGTTKANSAIVHAGFDARPDTMKGKLNAKGNAMFDEWSKELDFPFKRNGSFVLCFQEEDRYKLLELKEQGEINGVPNLKILNKEEALRMEPKLSANVVAALYAPTGGIVCPYEMTIALAENAYDNGVEFKFDSNVISIEKIEKGFRVITEGEVIESKAVVNAAGLYADMINNMVSEKKLCIRPRKGEYCLFDKEAGNIVSRTIFQVPTKLGKGILVTPTVDGNLLVGPNALEIEDKEDLATTKEGLEEILNKARLSVENLPMNQIITSFSGLRAGSTKGDFIIGEVEDAPGFINAAGIESPGLSSAPAIAVMVADIIKEKLKPKVKENFKNKREGIKKFREMSMEERAEIVKENPHYGKIVCRCEMVTEGEILEAIKRPLGARTLDGIKRRTRAGMGRCQSGFCTPKLAEIMARELKLDPREITKFGGKSYLLVGENKDSL